MSSGTNPTERQVALYAEVARTLQRSGSQGVDDAQSGTNRPSP